MSAVARYRRSPELVTFWQGSRLVYFNCRLGIRRTISADVLDVLARLGSWRTAAELRKQHPELGGLRDVAQLLDAFEQRGLVERKQSNRRHWLWDDWMPEAAFFHFGTRDGEYPADLMAHENTLREKAKTRPQPPPTKVSAGPRVKLPAAAHSGDLEAALLDRRTWRSFSSDPVPLQSVASLLGLTWGVQRRGKVAGQGEVVFKTSPSGGARHPIEAYVIARSISGLAPAAYHYDAAAHELVTVGGEVAKRDLVRVLANQYYLGDCAAVFVMTACFARTMWRYPFNRAYRSVLIEAGHLGQTFALLATSMKLAPFQTMAFQDRQLESLLGLDDSGESAMYVLGVGNRNPSVIDNPGQILPEAK